MQSLFWSHISTKSSAASPSVSAYMDAMPVALPWRFEADDSLSVRRAV